MAGLEAIVLSPCLHTICHGRSRGLALHNVVEIKHVGCCPADDCAGFFDITLQWELVSHPSFWSRRTEEHFSITLLIVAEHVTLPVLCSPRSYLQAQTTSWCDRVTLYKILPEKQSGGMLQQIAAFMTAFVFSATKPRLTRHRCMARNKMTITQCTSAKQSLESTSGSLICLYGHNINSVDEQ